MSRLTSPHFQIEQTEDGWILQARVTKDVQGDWMLHHDQLEELAELLRQAITV